MVGGWWSGLAVIGKGWLGIGWDGLRLARDWPGLRIGWGWLGLEVAEIGWDRLVIGWDWLGLAGMLGWARIRYDFL